MKRSGTFVVAVLLAVVGAVSTYTGLLYSRWMSAAVLVIQVGAGIFCLAAALALVVRPRVGGFIALVSLGALLILALRNLFGGEPNPVGKLVFFSLCLFLAGLARAVFCKAYKHEQPPKDK